MATIRKRPDGVYELRYSDANGERRSIYLPKKTTKLTAETVAAKVDHIVTRQITGHEPDRPVAEWLAGLSDKLYTKLAKAGLAPERIPAALEPQPEPEPSAPTVKQWIEQYIKKQPAKDSTIRHMESAAQHLVTHFGDERTIDTITPGDAEDYRNWLRTSGNQRDHDKPGLALNTTRRYIGRAKQFFQAAVRHQVIPANPFAGEKSAVCGNDERRCLVPAEWVERCIRVAPTEDWRIILALARYAGMRSHETRIQRWEDIDLVNNRMTIRSNKTPPVRTCPIFPELRPHLLRAREMAPAGAEFVQNQYSANANIGTTLAKIATKAGLVPWPKLMQNLRATRETELLACYPAKDVTSWLGNSPAIAHKHYAMALEGTFDRAAAHGTLMLGESLGVVPKKLPQKLPQTSTETGRQGEIEKTKAQKNPANSWVCLGVAIADTVSSCPAWTRPAPENTGFSNGQAITTPKTTPAATVAQLCRQYLSDDQLADLVLQLLAMDTENPLPRNHTGRTNFLQRNRD